MQRISNLPSGIAYNKAYVKALDATTDEDRLLHQEEQAKQLGLILHTEEVLRSNQFLAFGV
jgi:hypothetical protein